MATNIYTKQWPYWREQYRKAYQYLRANQYSNTITIDQNNELNQLRDSFYDTDYQVRLMAIDSYLNRKVQS